MSKWALLAAHRYLERDRRSVLRADGCSWSQGWRARTPQADAKAKRIRAARHQPWWPRPLGVALLGVAMLAALDPVVPMPTHVAASSARSPSGLLALVAEFPQGSLTSSPPAFCWSGTAAHGATTLVVFGADYSELARFDGIVGSSWPLPQPVSMALREQGELHWRVECGESGGRLYSPLQTFSIR